MISFYFFTCSVFQTYLKVKHPENYVEFLDVNRKDAYEIFELDTEDLYYQLVDLYLICLKQYTVMKMK